MKILALTVLLCIALASSAPQSGKVIYCYFEGWAVYNPGRGSFDVEDVDPNLCTHASFGFAGLNSKHHIYSLDPWNDLEEDYGQGAYKRFVKLKQRNPNLKVLLSIGGWNEGSTKYSKMASQASSRKIFIDSCVQFLQRFGFEGLDLDWEYPAHRGGNPEDQENHALLLAEMRTEFDKHQLMITAAVSAGFDKIDTSYNVPSISQSLDFINIMTYDFHGDWDPFVHHNTPLNVHPLDEGDTRKYNVRYAVEYWIEKGADRNKLLLGLAPYGRTFTLTDPKERGLYAKNSGAGTAGPYTGEAGYMNYNEICKNQMNHKWEITNDPDIGAPFGFYQNNQWAGWDDIESIKKKCQLVFEYNIGGGMIWAIDTDDFQGDCGGGKFPLVTAINKALRGGPDPTTTPHSTTPHSTTTTKEGPTTTTTKGTTTTSGPTTPGPTTGPAPDCTGKDGQWFPHTYCQKYWWCFQDEAHLEECGEGTIWDKDKHLCGYPDVVPHDHCIMP